jgi:rhamnogalacturonyl hydrolase YesR
VEEPTFEDEEITFTFEGKYFSVMVDFYAQDEWKIQSIAVWNYDKLEWEEGLFHIGVQKRLTKVMDREIENRGDNIFEEAYHGRIEATDWKDCYD